MRKYNILGVCSFIHERTRLPFTVGTMLALYTFSMMRGTDSMMVGLTFFIASINMVGVGSFFI